jgi:hypothetical protein
MENELTQTDTAYSLRSQRSLLEEDRARGEIRAIDDLIGSTERKVLELEKDKARTLGRISAGAVNQGYLSSVLEDLEDNRRKLTAYREQRALVENKIAQLAPNPRALGARAKEQHRLAQLVAERSEKDKQVNDALASLRQALQDRMGLTATMKESAAALDLPSDGDSLDAGRFDELFASLPEDLLARSQCWAAWFLGKEEHVKPYIVRDRLLAIPETLASHGVHHFGDRIILPEERARELMREDRPAPIQPAPWRCAPPSIMTVEAYEAAVSSAGKKGITVQEVLLWVDFERDAKIRERFPGSGSNIGAVSKEDLGEVVTIKVRAKSRISSDGGTYTDGDIFELHTRKWAACALYESGAIGRP